MASPYASNSSPVLSSCTNTTQPAAIILTNTPESVVKKNKCPHKECKRKITLVDFACKCGLVYCSSHRHFDSHNCTFDYREQSGTILQKQLVKCVNDRMTEKI